MRKFKILATLRLAVFVAGALLALGVAWPLIGTAQDKADKAKDPDTHAQHKDKQPPGDQSLASQIADLHAKVAKLEAALNQDHKGTPSGTPDKGGKTDKPDKAKGVPPGMRISAKFQNCAKCHQTRPSGALPPDHLEKAGGSDKGAKQDDKTGTDDNKSLTGDKAAMGDKGMGMKGGMGMGMKGGKGMGMKGGKGMGMMEEKKKAGMGMMEEKKKAGMGMMEEKKAGMGMGMGKKKGMSAMGGDKAETGGSTTEAMEQHMTHLMQLMQQMMELRIMEMKMKMMDKGLGTGAAPDPHHDHTGTAPETGGKADVLEKAPHPSVEAGKDLPAQVRELQARIAKLEAALKTRP